VIEGNANGQLASIIKTEVNFHGKLESLLKYDGTPFKYEEIDHKIKELI
jgi:2-oxoglutarate ferredoxin oxidoreductase subunit alpha